MPSDYIKKRSFPKRESDFIKEFMDEFKKIAKDSVWSFKTHGEPMQARGIPDILMCYHSFFIGMEFKIMRNSKLKVSPYQDYNIDLINKANGFGLVVWYDEANQECGINTKRFTNKKECARFLVDLLDKYSNIAPCCYSEIRNEGKPKSPA
jgi:hypothetical protein